MRGGSYAKPAIAVLLAAAVAWPGKIWAFYEWQAEESFVDLRVLLRSFASANRYPEESNSGIAGLARLMADGGLGEAWRLELNAYQVYLPESLQSSQGGGYLSLSTERSALLEHSFSNSDYLRFAVDRLALRWSGRKLDLTIGRQAINLATTFYFTPNDFFAPFAAQTFYRLYKPGVDALRAEFSLGEFSQLSLMSVLGYERDAGSDTGWSSGPDSRRISNLLRWSDVYGNFEGTLIAGRVVERNIIGGALQGELFEWLGIRLEGHHADATAEDYRQFTLGLEHRWESSLELRLELFYNGAGTSAVSRYQLLAAAGASQYLARRYGALGGRYDITPLLVGEAVVISNLDDQSHLLSLNVTYSLSNESETVLNASIPFGRKPVAVLKSEFGAYPKSINLEFRFYF